MKQRLTVEFAKANFGKKLSYSAAGYQNQNSQGEIVIEGILSDYDRAQMVTLADGTNQGKYWDAKLSEEQLETKKNTWVLMIFYHKDNRTNYEFPFDSSGDCRRGFYAYCHDNEVFTLGDSDREVFVEVID